MKTTSIFALLLITSLHCVQSEKIRCTEQNEVCACKANETVCEFEELRIDELQTFTSYNIQDIRGKLDVRGLAGDTYYMSPEGFKPSVQPDNGKCFFEDVSLTLGQDFIGKGCTIPMTVDGVSYRSFIGINSHIPGPTLIVNEGALVRVRVVNDLTSEGITIHWHGMHQNNTPWMDGVGFISQAPIGPGASFDYVFNATPPGTHWYHSHVGAQRTDGLFGALIVREKKISFQNTVVPELIALSSDPQPSYSRIMDKPAQHTLTLLDWQREASLDLFVKINSNLGFYNRQKDVLDVPVPEQHNQLRYINRTRSLDGIEVGPVPYWSGLINGRGAYDVNTADYFFNLSLFYIPDNTTGYRFRVVGAQSLYAYRLSIDDHKLRVIATDGHFIQPILVDFVIVHSGERYDFVPEQLNTFRRKYWIRADTLEVRTEQVFLDFDSRNEHSARAVLIYGDAQEEDRDWTRRYGDIPESPRERECTQSSRCSVLNCPFLRYPEGEFTDCIHVSDLVALPATREDDLPAFNTTRPFFFNFGFEGDSSTSAINAKNFKLPPTPYQTYCGEYDRNRNDSMNTKSCDQVCEENESCSCTNVVTIAEGADSTKKPQSVMMVFSAINNRNRNFEFSHPVHLHGHSFYVLHIGFGNYSEDGVLRKVLNNEVNCIDTACTGTDWVNGVPEEVLQANNSGSIDNTRIRKDTVLLPAGGYVVIAFRADNPGYWFLHCHIEVHQLEGMGVLIEEFPSEQHRVPPDMINQHGNFFWSIKNYTDHVKRGETCGAVGHYANVIFMLGAIMLILIM